jgi:hypothetical protein
MLPRLTMNMHKVVVYGKECGSMHVEIVKSLEEA